jgi:hypothetical protein
LRAVRANLDRQPIYSTTHWHPPLYAADLPPIAQRNWAIQKINHLNQEYADEQSQSATNEPNPGTHAGIGPHLPQRFHRRGIRSQRQNRQTLNQDRCRFPHKEGPGFSIELRAFPVDGRLVVLPPDGNDDNRNK